MVGDKVYGIVSNVSILSQKERLPFSSEVLEPLWTPSSNPSLHALKSMVNYENVSGGNTAAAAAAARPFFLRLDKDEHVDEDYDVGCFHQPGKKRRLTADQVELLERSFEVESKLEPERKVQLAKELGLKSRQVAIWFQNRRARFKSKQLEKDYESLKACYDKLKVDNENLLKEKESLKNEVNSLKEKLLIRGKEMGNAEPLDAIKLSKAEPQESIRNPISENMSNAPKLLCKQEDVSSAKSDVFYSNSPHRTNGKNHSSLLEPADSCHVFEPDQSDFPQDTDDNRSQIPLPQPFYLKLEDGCHDPPANYCNFGFPAEDQPFCFWNI
ncbi:hypothetical protein I3760_06G081200 [Carya illinoinensis]|nr:hypothetical protein I3760_06G081200 [Carya illinoinensis]